MSNNLFLTGKKGVGKTTIIKRVLQTLKLNPGGFLVGREGKKNGWLSFHFTAGANYLKKDEYEVKKVHRVFAQRDTPFDLWRVNTDVFNQEGVSLLRIEPNYDVIIMDELGRFELEAYQFQKKVLELLNSSFPVLGVLKAEHNPFLDQIRKHPGIIIYTVNEENREEIFQLLKEQVERLLEASIWSRR